MAGVNIKSEKIREYLLGKISDEKMLEEIEDLLFNDEEFYTQVELIEDQLINEYTFGNLSLEDTKSFETILENNPDLQFKLKLAKSLKEKAKEQSAEEKPSLLESINAFFRQPLYAGAFAAILVVFLISLFYLLNPKSSTEIAQLKEIYQKERPSMTRISGFEYAPYVVERSEQTNKQNENKLRSIEIKLIESVENTPIAENHHALGVFYITQKKYEKAIKNLKKATELDENNAKFHNDLGSVYFEFALNSSKEKRLEYITLANEEFSKALEINENFLEALFNKSMTLEDLKLPRRAKESWIEYLKRDATSKWAEEARKRLERLNQKKFGEKTDEQVLETFLNAYQTKDFLKVIQIHNETKGTFKAVTIPFQLTNRFLLAKKEPDPEKEKESIEALKYIGVVEKDKHSDFFVSELAKFYENITENQIEGLLNAKRKFVEGYKLVKASKYQEAIEKYGQSNELFLINGNELEANFASIWIGQILPYIGEIEESRKVLNSLKDSSLKQNFKIFIPTVNYWLGAGDFRQKRYSRSRKILKEGLDVAEKTENFFETQHISNAIIEYYVFFGEIESTKEFIVRIQNKPDSFFKVDSENYRTLISFAGIEGKLGNFSTKIDFAKESLYLSKELLSETVAVSNSLQELISALAKKKRFDEALKYSDESNDFALKKKAGQGRNRLLADIYLMRADLKRDKGDWIEAIIDYEKSQEFFERISQVTYKLFNVHKGKLLCFQKLNQQSNFQTELEYILKLSEEYRQHIREDGTRQAFFDTEQIVFDVAVSNALQQNKSKKAFGLVEKSKARSLLDFVRSEKSMAELEIEFSTLAKPLNIEDVQLRMPPNVQIVQYKLLDDKLVIWIITKNRFDLIEKKISAVDLEKKITEYRKTILNKSKHEDLNQLARELFEILIPQNLEKYKTLCLILDDSLHKIPLASLITPQGKYLIEEFSIIYSPSSSIFVIASENAKQKVNQNGESLLSIGNPQFDREENPNLANLPNAEIEAEIIAKNYPVSRIFLGQNATKVNFLNLFENTEIIHFAGHFVANGQSPRNSKLVFADESLRSFEFSEKKLLKSKLVVLSACETGFEKFNRSEGAIGIARTFLALGVPIVIASNWKVDSESTKNLMISFHQKRRTQKLSTIEALRQAQIELIKKEETKSPFYWSAFSPIGGLTTY